MPTRHLLILALSLVLTGCATPRSELAVEYRLAEQSELVVLGKIEVNP